MFSFSLTTATIALSALSASARVLPRHHAIAARAVTVPSSYDQDYLEDYFTYHARYLALGCQYNHGNDFFDACCHPLLKTESLSDREARCTPDAAVLSSISASLDGVTSTVASESSTAAAATSTAAPVTSSAVEAAVNAAAAPSTEYTESWSTTSSYSSSSDAWTSTSSSAETAATSSSSSSSSDVMTGGFATYFYQNGVAGACGTVHSDNDYVVAMDSQIYGQDICGKSVTITNSANGKSVTAVVADECPTCNNANSIDLSVATFLAIGELTAGLLDITWVWA